MPSYIDGASAIPLLGETIGQALDEAARRRGDSPALIFCKQGLSLMWRELVLPCGVIDKIYYLNARRVFKLSM